MDFTAIDRAEYAEFQKWRASKLAEAADTIERTPLEQFADFQNVRLAGIRDKQQAERSTLNQACDVQPAAPLLGFEGSVWSASETASRCCHMLEALHARIYGSRPENGCGYAEDAIREPDGALERMERALSSLHQNLGRMQGVIHLLAEVA